MIVYRVDRGSTFVTDYEVECITTRAITFKGGTTKFPRKTRDVEFFETKSDAVRHMLSWHTANALEKAESLLKANRDLSNAFALFEGAIPEEVSS